MKEKIRVASVNIIVFVSAIVFIVCGCALDSDINLIPPMAVSLFFLSSYLYANFYWKGSKRDE